MSREQLLHILYISPGGISARGGIGSVARNLIPALAEKDQPPVCTIIDSYGPGKFSLMPFYFLRALALTVWHAAFKTAHVAHIHMSHRGSALRKLALLRAARLFGLPTLLHIHGSEFEVYAESLRPHQRQKLITNLAYATHIAVLGTTWRDYLVNRLGLPAEKVSIIPNGVPLPPMVQKTANDTCRIVALGILSDRKGTPELLQALAAPRMQSLSWTALIAGNGDISRFRAEAKTLGLTSRVEMPGWISPVDAQQRLAEADIFVLPSRNEGLPMAILEAMALGKAVVTTSVGAIADLVVQDETGFMIKAGDKDALAEALVCLIEDPARRLSFGNKARQTIEEKFTVKHMAQNVIGLYHKLAVKRS